MFKETYRCYQNDCGVGDEECEEKYENPDWLLYEDPADGYPDKTSPCCDFHEMLMNEM